jgi:hypothetical protein
MLSYPELRELFEVPGAMSSSKRAMLSYPELCEVFEVPGATSSSKQDGADIKHAEDDRVYECGKF